MVSGISRSVMQRAKAIYASDIRSELERTNPGEFICIEPDSGKYFLGSTFDEAVNGAMEAFPDQLTFTMRIGQTTALHLGEMSQ